MPRKSRDLVGSAKIVDTTLLSVLLVSKGSRQICI